MSSWVNDTAVPNHHGNGFPQISDPSAVAGAMMDPSAFMGSPAQFNQQFATTQPMIMPNGPMRNASPGFANPMYQTNPVVPTKRPRPREDSIGQSPRQAPGMLPTSRSETPQSQFSAFSQPGVQQAGQAQYPHLQPNGSANATPSPIMANQMRPGSVPQRVSTTSPHPFSPAAQQFPQQSPIPSEHSVTPQPYMHQQANPYQQGFNPQFNPAQSPARPSPTPNPMAGQMMPQQMMPQRMQQMQGQMPSQMTATGQMPNHMFNPQQMAQGQNQLDQQQQRMMYQMQIQQQAQAQRTHMMQQQQMQNQGNPNQAQAQAQAHAQAQVQAQQQAQAQAQARNMMAARQGMPNGQMPPGQMPGQMQGQIGQMSPGQIPQGQMPQGQMPQGQMPQGQMPPGQMRPQHPMPQQGPMARMLQPEGFMKNLVAFMNSKNLPLETNPVIDGRPVSLFHLFQRVSKFRGYRNVTQSNLWPQVAASLQWAPQQFPQAPPQLKAVYERNLIKYEEMLKMRQQHQEQQAGMPNPQTMQPGTPTKPMQPGQAQQPPHMMGPGGQPQLQQAPMASPIKPPGQHPGAMNGFPAPHPAHGQPPPGAQGHARNSLSRSAQAPSEQDFSMPSPAQSKSGSVSLPGSAHPESQAAQGETAATMRFPAPFASNPEEYMPCSREVSTYGGVDLKAIEKVAEDLRHSRVDLPAPIELGIVDLHALTKSIQSGIHGEVRLALDNLAALTVTDHYGPFPIPQIDLRYCDELVETLVECAEEQADLLAENSEEASNEVTLPLYEEVTRACRIERLTLRKISVLGTQSYELDRAVDRLICITTILRNLSDASVEQNQKILAEESVIKFLCVVIRYLGTREMLCQTNANTLDLMKDIVILLSNIASEVEIPGREQAFCLLQFLLSFAPSPTPTSPSDTLFFAAYDPALHPYLPHAVDALAKLLARDQPNRSFYEAIFAADAASTTAPCELLTRTFALAISPIPLPTVDHPRDPRLTDAFDSRPPNFPSLVEVRKPILMQGLLAADILALIAPRDSGVTRAWLASGDGFSRNLFLLARQLGAQFENTVLRHGGGPQSRNQPRRDADLSYIVRLAVRLLKRLSESARDSDPTCPIPAQALPNKELVLGALQMQAPEWSKEGMLGDLVAFAKLGI